MLSNRKLLVIVFLISSFFPVINIIKYVTTSPNFYYASYGSDEATFLAVEKSYIWNFISPWLASNDSIFHDIITGSNFVLAPFGIFNMAGIDLRLLFLVTKFLLALGYFIISYNVIKYFFPEKKKTDVAFLLFMLAIGLGGVAYFAITNVPFLQGIVAPENYIYVVGGGSLYTVSLGQLYLVISLVAGYTSLLMFFRKKHDSGTLFLSLSIIAYPSFGAVFFAADFLYLVLHKTLNRTFFLSLLAYFPWLIVYLQKPIYFEEYASTGLTYTNIFAFIVYGGFVLLFSAYAYYRFIKIYLKTRKINKDIIFLLMLGAITVIISIIPTSFTLVAPRYIHLTILPLTIIATYGIFEFSKKFSISPKVITSIIILLSLPTIFVFYSFVVQPAGVYITEDEHNALNFLKNQPFGNAISSRFPIGNLLPYYAEKRSMLGRMTGTLEKPLIEETSEFFSGNDVTRKKEIIQKHNITYVFYGPRELDISKNFSPDSLRLVKIYENNTTKIYRTVE